MEKYRKIDVNINALFIRLNFEKNYYKFNVYQKVRLFSVKFLGSKINELYIYIKNKIEIILILLIYMMS